ncbi:MAG TPA: alpha/beta hydrolase [Vicinamibacterales bacterium]|nr:alpha/beta hydrolase [Vicinamibacterales bacterium]
MDTMTRRQVLRSLAALAPAALVPVSRAGAQPPAAPRTAAEPLPAAVLPRGIRARFVNNVNGIRMHVLEAGFDGARRPAVLLVHGFPELAYSWRKVMLPIAAAGYHVIAPDLRGYGRTGGTEVAFDDDLSPWRTQNEVTDMVALVSAFGYRSITGVVGHDFGSPVAAWCSVVRPDIFRSTVLMSAPFAGTPAFPFNTADAAPPAAPPPADTLFDDLAKLSPPRKYYQRYYSTRDANDNMWHAPQGVHAFLRAYYHMKSADWKDNHPAPLAARTAAEWAKMPRYYVMDLDKGMAETVAPETPPASAIAANRWLPDEELRVYSGEYGRTGFQGGLQSYRVGSSGRFNGDLLAFAGRTIDQPSMFIAGRSDWGAYQNPGALERMQKTACTRMVGTHFVDGAGHWVQQEQPEKVSALIVEFLQRNAPREGSG